MRLNKLTVILALAACLLPSCSKDSLKIDGSSLQINSALIYYEGYTEPGDILDNGGYFYNILLSDAANPEILENEDFDNNVSFLFSCQIAIPDKKFSGEFPFKYGEYDEYYVYATYISLEHGSIGFSEGTLKLKQNGDTYTIKFNGTGEDGETLTLKYSGKAKYIDESEN